MRWRAYFVLSFVSFAIGANAWTAVVDAPTVLKKSQAHKCARVLAVSAGVLAGITGAYLSTEAIYTESSEAEVHRPGRPGLSMVLIGDSLSRDVHITSKAGLFWSIRTERMGGWYLDNSPQPDTAFSLFERVGEKFTVKAGNYARPAAYVDGYQDFNAAKDFVFLVRHFSQQVDEVLAQKELPDLVMIYIGNNNLDWRLLPEYAQKSSLSEDDFRSLGRKFAKNWRQQLERLERGLARDGRRHAVYVLGLGNFPGYMTVRDDLVKTGASQNYPYFQTAAEEYCTSMKSEFCESTRRLYRELNGQLDVVVYAVAQENSHGRGNPNLKFYFDPVTSRQPYQRSDFHAHDGWHFSTSGHSELARRVFESPIFTRALEWALH